MAKKKAAVTPNVSAARSVATPQASSWLESLELDPFKKEVEEQKKKEREEKAVKAQQLQLWENEKHKQHEKEWVKLQRKKALEEKKQEMEMQRVKAVAFTQGVLEAEDWGDAWYVSLPGGLYKKVSQQYFCSLCEKHLNDNSLEAHIESDGHRKKVAGNAATQVGMAASTASPKLLSTMAPGSSTTPLATKCASWALNGQCTLCNKLLDGVHEYTEAHLGRVIWFEEQETLRKSGYKAPLEPYLAYVPCDESDPNCDRWLKCLLCNKFVQDNTSHFGSWENPQGSKDHQKNLRNYKPNDPWWKINITAIRDRYHPKPSGVTVCPSQSTRPDPLRPSANSAKLLAAPAQPLNFLGDPEPAEDDGVESC